MMDADELAWNVAVRGDSIWEELTHLPVELSSAVVLDLVLEAARAVAKEDDALFSNFEQSVKAALELGRRHGVLDD